MSSNANEYIWVSYSKADADTVMSIVGEIQNQGFRIRLEISPEENTSEAEEIACCGYVMVFLSHQYLSDENCVATLKLARDLEKHLLLIYLDDVQMSQALAMRVGRNQAIFYNRYKQKDAFFKKIYEASDIQQFHTGSLRYPEDSQNTDSGKHRKKPVIVILAAALTILCLISLMLQRNRSAEMPQQALAQESQRETEDMPASLIDAVEDTNQFVPEADDRILVQTEDYEVVARNPGYDDTYWMLELICFNRSDAPVSLSLEEGFVNDMPVKMHWGVTIPAGERRESALKIPKSQWYLDGMETVAHYRGCLTVCSSDGEDIQHRIDVHPEGELAAEKPAVITVSEPVFENETLQVYYLGCSHFEDFSNDVDRFYVKNRGETACSFGVSFSVRDTVQKEELVLEAGCGQILCYPRDSMAGDTPEQGEVILHLWNRQFGAMEDVDGIFVNLKKE